MMVKNFLVKLRAQVNETQNELTIKGIIKFYYPLALTSLLTLGIQPFVTFFIGQSRMPLESFAVMPVVTSFVFIFRGLGLSFQEVVVALIGDNMAGFDELKKFAIKLAIFVAGTLMLIAFTPLAEIWFRDISGLSCLLYTSVLRFI